jgi:hypothetical protein
MARKYVENDDDVLDQVNSSARKGQAASLTNQMKSKNQGPAGWDQGHDPMVGRNDFAGLPGEKVMKSYPKGAGLTKNERIDDTMSEIDDVCERSEGKRKKYLSNQH